ncbi:hypothetical protein MtrunA17_Chr1g0181321 [Medicago truncatula]|uniref:Uncharacterized protein n=1 Tax=Medicago truncatula TaxID=3880 RepID=A0A396JRE8_MEDTR|nr:hypothetical protein MtrunA17_Chr1g0181321 [Medicago truncatula]
MQVHKAETNKEEEKHRIFNAKGNKENVERRDIKEEKQRKRNKYPSYS